LIGALDFEAFCPQRILSELIAEHFVGSPPISSSRSDGSLLIMTDGEGATPRCSAKRYDVVS
jgi:hypothetical protein